ncbi:MAG TPA: hypothetical protein VLY87_07915 [Flavobacterium sp.]|nr:hypothetical protein [Flavobacterium sp.]
MKRLGFILVSIIFLTLGTSCKTKQVNTDKLRVEQTQDYDYTVLLDYLSKNQSTKELTETERAEFKEFISNLNINYDGTDINDKMDVLLKKLADGTTQLTLQGKGTANYNQSDKTQFEALQKYFKSYQDSIQKVNATNQEQLKNDLFVRIDEKTKQVDSKTFTWQVWLIIGLAVFVGMLLNWISKQFKPLLKAV